MRPAARVLEPRGSDSRPLSAFRSALFGFSEGFLVLALPYDLIMSLSAAVSGGLAVVLFTMAVRAALLPLSIRAARAANPSAGLPPLLLQIPFLWMLYSLFTASTVAGHPNGLLGQSFLGVDLGTRFFTDPGALVFWLVFAALMAI